MAGGDPNKVNSFVQACDFDGDGKIGLQDYIRFVYVSINRS